jgi:hypothetical protein
MLFNKRGFWVFPRSLWFFIIGAIFIIVSFLPFDFLPFSFDLSSTVLSIFIVAAGLIILFGSFSGISQPGIRHGRFARIIFALVLAAFGIYVLLMNMGSTWLSYAFSLNELTLQIIFIFYSIYLFIGAWMQ